MKKLIASLAVFALMSMASIALARGAPEKHKAFAVQTATVDVAPIVRSVPPQTAGYDVINNLTDVIAGIDTYTDTSEQTRQSTTVAERTINVKAPRIVLLA